MRIPQTDNGVNVMAKAGPSNAAKDTASKRKKTEKTPSPFEVSKALLAELEAIGTRKAVEAGTMLFRKGEPTRGVFVMLSGRVALSSGDDPVRITRVAERGSLLGLPATVLDNPYSLSAEAVVDSEVSVIPPARFRSFLSSNTRLGVEVVNILAEEIAVLRQLAVYQL